MKANLFVFQAGETEMLFYFSDAELPATASAGIVFLLIILFSPIVVFYWVFRNREKRNREFEIIQVFSKWLSLICAVLLLICLSAVIVISWQFTGEGLSSPLNYELGTLLFLTIIFSAALSFIFGTISLPHWQGILAVLCFVIYFIYFITL